MLTVPHGAMLAAAAVGAPALAGALLAGALLDVQAPRMIANVATTAARRRGPCRTRVISPPLGPAACRGRQIAGSARRAGTHSPLSETSCCLPDGPVRVEPDAQPANDPAHRAARARPLRDPAEHDAEQDDADGGGHPAPEEAVL